VNVLEWVADSRTSDSFALNAHIISPRHVCIAGFLATRFIGPRKGGSKDHSLNRDKDRKYGAFIRLPHFFGECISFESNKSISQGVRYSQALTLWSSVPGI
jgi:hypothetical protein